MRADRLLTIVLLLQVRKRMTAQELAERLEVSERTIYCDIQALSQAGIPVYAEAGTGGGYSLIKQYQTRLTGLTRAEVRARPDPRAGCWSAPRFGSGFNAGCSAAQNRGRARATLAGRH